MERWKSDCPLAAGAALENRGRAERFAVEDGELWRMPRDDERAARRLVSLGESGVGGFASGGTDAQGVWLLRRVATRRLDSLPRGERWTWRDAVTLVRDIARALDACEKAGLFPGALRIGDIVRGPIGEAWLLADPLVHALVGGGGDQPRSTSAASPKWTPPEQVEGAPWDNAANRYVLGLVAYRLVAGAHPFGGAGLRHALAEQGTAAPPFEDEIARELRPGVQSFVLSMIDPSRARRPRDAAAVVRRCEELLRDADAPTARRDPTRTRDADAARSGSSALSAPASRRAPRGFSSRRVAVAVVPIALALAVAAALLLAAPPPAAPRARREIAPARLAGTTSADCVGCHAREVAEWQRSVMAHAAKSPLYGALESAVEEQIGREESCPNGAGVLRKLGTDVCRDAKSGLTVTGTGGEHWCVSCHAPGENLRASMPAWNALGAARSRAPMRDLLPAAAMEGVSCAACHQTSGPVAIHRAGGAAYEGNATWTSPFTGSIFLARPEDGLGRSGIANSGYLLDPSIFLGASPGQREGSVHRRAPSETTRYLRSSEFCGACHDVRLFGSDAVGAPQRGEHFKRLRNAYSEWRAWADAEARAGRAAAGCSDCHMSLYPGACAPGGGGDRDCPSGSRFVPAPAGKYPVARVAPSSADAGRVGQHYFTSVDIPLTDSFPDAFVDDRTLDSNGLPLGLRARRDMLLRHTFRFELGAARRSGRELEIPVLLQNTGAGHRVPAGFSQEREIWVELTVTDGRGAVVYEVGKIATPTSDLRDKIFVRVNTSDRNLDDRGRPLGVFGADVTDGPDVPAWTPNPARGGTTFRGKGLVNLQNGFLRCVKCIGTIDAEGRCQPRADQGRTRADRFDDAPYDLDTGECRSNLKDGEEFFETYFPVGALDAERGVAKAPDAIIDTRSAPPGTELTYTYVLDVADRPPPFRVEAKLRFRAFPPFLVRAFGAYEAAKNAEGARPSGAQVSEGMLRRLEPVDLAIAGARID